MPGLHYRVPMLFVNSSVPSNPSPFINKITSKALSTETIARVLLCTDIMLSAIEMFNATANFGIYSSVASTSQPLTSTGPSKL